MFHGYTADTDRYGDQLTDENRQHGTLTSDIPLKAKAIIFLI